MWEEKDEMREERWRKGQRREMCRRKGEEEVRIWKERRGKKVKRENREETKERRKGTIQRDGKALRGMMEMCQSKGKT